MSEAGRNWKGRTFKASPTGGRTHKSVLHVNCPRCKAKKGSLCVGYHGPMLMTHLARRHKYRGIRKRFCGCQYCNWRGRNKL